MYIAFYPYLQLLVHHLPHYRGMGLYVAVYTVLCVYDNASLFSFMSSEGHSPLARVSDSVSRLKNER